jgi:hypothetical protein
MFNSQAPQRQIKAAILGEQISSCQKNLLGAE